VGRWCAGWVAHARNGVGVGDADLGFEAVGVGEEEAVGVGEERLSAGPKSVTKLSDAPISVRRRRMSEKASIDAAPTPRWSSRPRPNMGVWRVAWSMPSISKIWSSVFGIRCSVFGPMVRKVSRNSPPKVASTWPHDVNYPAS